MGRLTSKYLSLGDVHRYTPTLKETLAQIGWCTHANHQQSPKNTAILPKASGL